MDLFIYTSPHGIAIAINSKCSSVLSKPRFCNVVEIVREIDGASSGVLGEAGLGGIG